MTWSRVGESPVQISAYAFEIRGQKRVRLSIGLASTDLKEADASSLGGYLLGITNNETTPEVSPELPTETTETTETTTVSGDTVEVINPDPPDQLEAGKVAPPTNGWIDNPDKEN